MKTLIVFYSYSGHTKAKALEYAALESADTVEIKDVHRPGKLKAYTSGCFASMRGKAWPMESLSADLAAFDSLILFSPVWAGNPPPAVNALLEQLPKGKTMSVKMVSAGGHSSCKERMEAVIKTKGCILDDFEDIKG